MDKYEEELESMLIELKACKEYNIIKGCNFCRKQFDCKIRTKYVDAVYNSMAKGKPGGFKF